MVYLIIFLTISHIVVLYLLRKDIIAYKMNNQLFIHRELEVIQNSFDEGVHNIATTVDQIQSSSKASFQLMEKNNNHFEWEQKHKFQELNNFIKKDYTSLTTLLAENNTLLSKLLKDTEKNILHNEALQPLLVNSNDELEKVYSKIRQVVTNCEKHLKDVKADIANTLEEIHINAESKVRQLATEGEKNINESVKGSMDTIKDVSTITVTALNSLLSENHISHLTSKVTDLDKNIQEKIISLQTKNDEISSKMETLITRTEEGGKKSRWGL